MPNGCPGHSPFKGHQLGGVTVLQHIALGCSACVKVPQHIGLGSGMGGGSRRAVRCRMACHERRAVRYRMARIKFVNEPFTSEPCGIAWLATNGGPCGIAWPVLYPLARWELVPAPIGAPFRPCGIAWPIRIGGKSPNQNRGWLDSGAEADTVLADIRIRLC